MVSAWHRYGVRELGCAATTFRSLSRGHKPRGTVRGAGPALPPPHLGRRKQRPESPVFGRLWGVAPPSAVCRAQSVPL